MWPQTVKGASRTPKMGGELRLCSAGKGDLKKSLGLKKDFLIRRHQVWGETEISGGLGPKGKVTCSIATSNFGTGVKNRL